jgi:hypothetical protein
MPMKRYKPEQIVWRFPCASKGHAVAYGFITRGSAGAKG